VNIDKHLKRANLNIHISLSTKIKFLRNSDVVPSDK